MTASPFKNHLEQKKQDIAAKKMKLEIRQNKKKSAEQLKEQICKLAKKKKKEKKRTCRDSRSKKKVSLGNSTEKAVSKSRRLKYTLLLKPSSRRQMFDVQHAMSLYCDPPDEDWIQCACCHRWWHENCSAYDGGNFHCDLCA